MSSEGVALESANVGSAPSGRQWMAWVFVVLVVLVVLLLAGGYWVLKESVLAAQAQFERYQCASRLKNIGIAMQNYHDAHGAWPPAVVTDAEGRRIHSWRVLILPHLGAEEEELYK